MTDRRRARAAFLPLLTSLLVLLVVSLASAANWRTSVDPMLLLALDDSAEVEFIVRLRQQANLSRAGSITSKNAKGAFVYNTLLETAEGAQSDLLAELTARNIQHRSFWIVNAIHVRADAAMLRDLARHPDVDYIFANSPIDLSPPIPEETGDAVESAAGIEWNIQLIGAPELWAMSINGQGVVIGGQDTGYQWDHPALKNQYRGWDGHVANHDYNWHDALHAGTGNPCGFDSPAPCDDHGHGTHTMGTMVGDDDGANQIGVAPGARWIGCRNMDRGVGTPDTYIECYQWFIAPTEIGGGNPDPARAPDIINNSWSCPVSEGCDEPDILREAVEAVRAAGILTVHSAGNSGSQCATINAPAAIYDASFTVGATTSADQIAGFSARGPVMVDGSSRLKPDVVAPGVNIRSSYFRDNYAYFTGTSMAAPHVAGLAALLISAEPDLAGDVDRLERSIMLTAVPKTAPQDCYGFSGDQIPNAVYGHGRIDAVASWRLATGPSYLFPLILHRAQPAPLIAQSEAR